MRVLVGALLIGAIVVGGRVAAQESFVYPAKGQSPEQQRKDAGECHVWAVEQTGFDPATA